jgi:type IV secretion system protein VirD4
MVWNGNVPLGFDKDTDQPIGYEGNAPVLVIGPPGSNKTVGIVINQLLDDTSQRSYIVMDPKGEVCAVTSRFRRQIGDVKIINPYNILVEQRPDMASDGWNPLGDLDPTAFDYADEVLARSTALIRADANLAQPYFSDASRSAVAGTTNYEVQRSRELGLAPSLPHVRYNLTLEPAALAALVRQMIATNDPDIVTRVRKFLEDNREIQSIKSTIEVDTSWMTPAMRQDMSVPLGVDFRAAKQTCTTVYIIIPPKELLTKAAYFRLLTSTCLRHCYRYDGVPVTLLVEEAFVLGHLDELENAGSILRGFNGRLLIVYQTLGQAKKHFPNTWGLFGGGATLAFRPAEPETASYLVQRAGQIPVPMQSRTNPSRMGDGGPSITTSYQIRDRIPLHKMFGMPQGTALVWLPGDEAPRVSRVKGYFELGLNRRADPNPYYHGPAARRGWFGFGRRG